MEQLKKWQTPFVFLGVASAVIAITFSAWMAMLNNFAIERAQFGGAEIGILQSLREVPGFLAFTAVFILLMIKEQTLAVVSLALLAVSVSITGLFPTIYGLYATTVLMSIGYHYFETVNQSLALQWFKKDQAPQLLGRLLSLTSIISLLSYGFVWLGFHIFSAQYLTMYAICGGIGLLLTIFLWVSMPAFKAEHVQHKHLVLRKKYSLYYLLTFLSGARRQIFVVFAGFLMVEKFGYSVAQISALYMLNHLINIFAAPQIGKLIQVIGERKALTLEYIGLICVFVGYGVVEQAEWAAFLYVVDHLFFAMAIALKTYFQKIADPKDIASSAGVSFTINHIAAVIIPAVFGMIWLINASLVFYAGAMLACCSLLASQWVKINNP
ncbi:hypothetical protein PULV_a2822 [Pseudoalteromonas ulvae UL12]|uniref:MFS transporter n=1 Tax=Pseudoalteromonas ulvae TaxID=107327 RepID=UPI00186B897D|nr:MFS transporter [Pseudoalteromonas ulvae]MBE0364478.1 hypothetical protein [Pseudoalteromonas ulvae UL12]